MKRWLIAFLAILIVMLLPTWPHSEPWGWGYYPSALLGIALVAVLLMAFVQHRRSLR